MISLLFSKMIFSSYQTEKVMESFGNVYYLQYASFTSKEVMNDNIKKLDNYLLYEIDNKYYVYLGIYRNLDIARKMNILFENNGLPSSKSHVRRIVGMPGDTIYMRDYVLYIKPAGERHFLTEFEIVEEPYNVTFYVPPADWDTEIGVKGSFDEITLGYNEYFVLADNRKSSDDSRLWGAVKKDEITAKVLMCYFPFRNFKLL